MHLHQRTTLTRDHRVLPEEPAVQGSKGIAHIVCARCNSSSFQKFVTDELELLSDPRDCNRQEQQYTSYILRLQ